MCSDLKLSKLPADTRRLEDVPWRSLQVPKVRDLQGTFTELLGDQHKNWWWMKKVFYSLCLTHLLLFFTGKTNIQKFWMGTSTGFLWDPLAGCTGHQMMGRSGDVRGTLVKRFLNSAQKRIELTLTGYSRIIIIYKKNNLNRNETCVLEDY